MNTTGLSNKWSWIKPLIIFVLLLILLIPIGFIKSLIGDRAYYRTAAEESIMEPVGGQPALEGMVIAVPYRTVVVQKDEKTGLLLEKIDIDYIIVIPETYSLSTEINPYYLSRGIFDVPVFNGEIAVNAEFPDFSFEQFNIRESDIMYKDAVLILGIGNKKTFTSRPALLVNGTRLAEALTNPDSASPFTESVFYSIAETVVKDGFALTGTFTIQGGKSISIVPIASDSEFAIRSDWVAPSFSGGWLPTERVLTDDGFSAKWNISGLSTSFPRTWNTRGKEQNVISSAESIVVTLISPINSYSQTKRSTTYAILFLMVPFLAIFICELWSNSKIHPIQYCLIGIVDILFYLLLLSVSEHISFNMSYLLAAAAVCGAVLFYATAIFKNIIWGVLLSGVQAISYLLLFGILQSEDYALLLGSTGLFCVVVLLMYLTRKVDWYGKMQQK